MAATLEGIVTWMGGRGFASVLLYLAGGVVLTLMVQSSSAAMAITMTCALNGWLGDVNADPIGGVPELRRHRAGRKHRHHRDRLAGGAGGQRACQAGGEGAFRVQHHRRLLDALCLLSIQPSLLESGGNVAGFPAQGERKHGQLRHRLRHGHFPFRIQSDEHPAVLVAFVPQIARLVEWWVRDPQPEAGVSKLQYISQGFVDLGELNIAEAENAAKRMGATDPRNVRRIRGGAPSPGCRSIREGRRNSSRWRTIATTCSTTSPPI